MSRQYSRISDDELQSRLNAVRAMIRRTRKNDGDTTDAEVELCYLERELEHRDKQKLSHVKYLADLKKSREMQAQAAREEQEALNEYLED
jgi:hypothetical protein